MRVKPEMIGGAEVLKISPREDDLDDEDCEDGADDMIPAVGSSCLPLGLERPVTPWRHVSDDSAKLMMCKAPSAAPTGPTLDVAHDSRQRALEATLRRQASCEQATVLWAWARATLEARTVRNVEHVQAKAWEHVVEVRRSRRQLFTAALQEQARYWQADAFATWRQRMLEVRCKRPPLVPLKAERGLETTVSTSGSSDGTVRVASSRSTPRSSSTPRLTGRHGRPPP